jgi:predicted DNA-binding antitoxin AbrB/MazE fold protein
MPFTIDATYENGILRPDQALPLRERERVKITIHAPDNLAQQNQGLIGWQGPAEIVERIALAPLEEL